jgi:hypothetical protein
VSAVDVQKLERLYHDALKIFSFNAQFLRTLAHDHAEWLNNRKACGRSDCLVEHDAQWGGELGDLDLAYCEAYPHDEQGWWCHPSQESPEKGP